MADTNKAGITSLYVDVATGDLCITVSHAVKRDGAVLGVVGIDILVNILQDQVFAATLDATGYSMLLDKNGDILIHPDKEYAPNDKGEFKNLSTVKGGVYSDLWRKISTADDSYKHTDANGTVKYYTSSALDATGWHMVTVLPESVVTQPIFNVIFIVIPITLVLTALAALLIFLSVKNMITKPIRSITAAAEQLSAGDPDVALTSSGVTGEMETLARAFSDMATGIKTQADSAERIANGDLTAEVPLRSERDVMGKALGHMLENLNSMFTEINLSAAQVSSGSKQVADGSQALAQGSTEQAAAVEQLSASISEIADKTKANAEMAGSAARLAENIRASAEKGSAQMKEMVRAVEDINTASQSISKVIKVIDEIAFKTNILAINASIEAAHAGQQGQGFAVVAGEVRTLAEQSADAAKETGIMIENTMEKAALGTRIAGETASSLGEIVHGINESTKLVMDIARSSEEQAAGTRQINTGIDQVAGVIQQNSATSEESAAAAEEMSSQSDMLTQIVSRFKLRDGDVSGLSATRAPSGRKRPQLPARGNDFGDGFGKY